MLRAIVLAGAICCATSAFAYEDLPCNPGFCDEDYARRAMEDRAKSAELDRRFEQNMAIMHDMDDYYARQVQGRIADNILQGAIISNFNRH